MSFRTAQAFLFEQEIAARVSGDHLHTSAHMCL